MEEVSKVFNKFDKNGKTSAAELHSVLKKVGEKCTSKDCVKMMSQVDKNGDGKISPDELSRIQWLLDSEEPLRGIPFDTLVEECTKDANGNKSLKEKLMTSHVVKGFVHKLIRDAISAIEKKEERCKRSRQASRIESSNKFVTYLGVVEEEGQIVKKPAAKKPWMKMKASSLKKKRPADSCLEEKDRKKKRSTTVQKNNLDKQLGLNSLPDLSPEFKDRILGMNGKKVMLVAQKALTPSDMNNYLGRFSVPKGQVRSHEFLTEEEKLKLNWKGYDEISCSFIQPCLEEIIDLKFKKWDMNKIFTYSLIKKWNYVANYSKNQLVKGSKVQLWSFRVDSQPWFAMIKLE